MRKTYLFLLLLLTSTIIIYSCSKKEVNEPVATNYKHTATPIENYSETENFTKASTTYSYRLDTYYGHLEETCNGCILLDGILIHVDCCGPGGICNKVAEVSLSYRSDLSLDATTIKEDELTDGDIFLMPDRSFFVLNEKEEKVWLNIPKQLSIRDSETRQFKFTNLFFSDHQVFKNE